MRPLPLRFSIRRGVPLLLLGMSYLSPVPHPGLKSNVHVI